MPPKRKRGRPATKKATAETAPSKTKRGGFVRKKEAVSSIRQLLRRIKHARLPSRDEDSPMTTLEDIFTRLLSKLALDFTFFNQALSTCWSNRAVSRIKVVSEDVQFKQPVTLFVRLVRQVIDGAYGDGVDKTEELKLEELQALWEWTEALWIEVEKLAEEEQKLAADDAASPSQLASPEPSDTGSTSRARSKSKSKRDGKKPVSRDYSSSSEDDPEERDELESDNDQPAPAQTIGSKKRVGVKAVKVAATKKATAKGKAMARTSQAASADDENELSPRRRSNRQSTHTQTAKEAANSKPRYTEGSVLFVTIRDGVKWLGAIINEENANDGGKVQGEYQPGDYLVQLVPSRERYWIPPNSTSSLPIKTKRELPPSLKSREKSDYRAALDLLLDDQGLDSWLFGNQSDEEEEVQAAGEDIVSDSDPEEQPAPKKVRRS